MKFTKEKWDTRQVLLTRLLDAAVCIQEPEDRLRRTKNDLRAPVVK